MSGIQRFWILARPRFSLYNLRHGYFETLASGIKAAAMAPINAVKGVPTQFVSGFRF